MTTKETRKVDKILIHHGVRCTLQYGVIIKPEDDLIPMYFVGNGMWYKTKLSKMICNDKKVLKEYVKHRILDAMENMRTDKRNTKSDNYSEQQNVHERRW